MSSASQSTGAGGPRSDRTSTIVASVGFMLVFAGAYLLAEGWSFRAALFPQLIGALGFLLALLRLLTAFKGRPAPAPSGVKLGDVEVLDDETAEALDVEYVFANAGRAAWVSALAWVAGFFLSLWLLGLYVTVIVFPLVYLRVVARSSWLVAVLYGVIAGAVLYAAFELLLRVPVPAGRITEIFFG